MIERPGFIERLVRWSLDNRPVVYALSILLTLAGTFVAARTPVDVLPWTCNGFVPVTYLITPPWLRMRAG
jgi:Cu/Ag efflux pump CusA